MPRSWRGHWAGRRWSVVPISASTLDGRTFSVGSRRFAEGTGLSVDGAGGDVFEGIVPLSQPASSSTGLGDVLRVAREAAGNCRILGLCTTPGQVTETLERGADGIGIRLIDLLVASGAIEQLADELSAQRHRDQRGPQPPRTDSGRVAGPGLRSCPPRSRRRARHRSHRR